MLDDTGLLKRLDLYGVADVLAALPDHCRGAAMLAPSPAAVMSPPPRVILVAAMGGSAAGADLMAACASERLDVPILVHRGYGLPRLASRDTLVVASSYSGETAEVVSALDAAVAGAVPAAVITTGGRLGQRATAAGLPLVRLPNGLMPRMGLAYLLFPLLRILADVGLPAVTGDEVEECVEVVTAQAAALGPGRPAAQNEAKRLALAIADRLPAVYGGPLTAPAAYRWKTDLEENAKTLAIAGALPEMNHNEIEAWRAPRAGMLHALLLRDAGEPPEIARRFTLTAELMAPVAGGGVSQVWTRGRGRLARLVSLAYLGEWTSYYVAMLRAVDPWSVPLLDELKRRSAAVQG